MSAELREILLTARAAADAGAREALARFRRRDLAVDDKAAGEGYDPVTEADRASEAACRRVIVARYPEHGILGEEEGETPGRDWRWVLDPIDGTRSFVCGTPTWTTLVGVEREGRAEVGVIAQPFTDEEWWGTAEGAFHRVGGGSTRCRVSGRTHLAEARVATTDVRATPQGSFTEDEAQAFLRVAAECPVARFGMDAYAYGLLARGDHDLVIESGLQRYDVAALLPILRGAGAVVSSWSGGDPSGGGSILAASSPRLHAAACALLAG